MKIIKRVLKIILYVLLSLIVLFSFYSLVMTGVLKKDYVKIFNHTYFVVASGSMSGTIEVNDIIIVDLDAEYKEDDIITFKEDNAFITHRVVSVEGSRVITKGDVNKVNDEPINKSAVIGKVKYIISMSMLLKVIGIIILLVLVYAVINFDKIFKKYIIKRHDKREVKTPLEYTQVLPIIRENTEDKTTLKEDEIPENNADKPVLEAANEEIKKNKEKKLINLVLSNINSKEKRMKITKNGSLKLKYMYELVMTVSKDSDGVEECLKDAPFKEVYDYEFEVIGFTKEIRDKLSEMPIYVYLKLLVYTILYDNEEYFDAIFKVLKSRVKVDRNKEFVNNKRLIDDVSSMIEKVVEKIGYKEEFALTKIKDKVKTTKLLRNLELNNNDEQRFVSIVLKILGSESNDLKVSTSGSVKLKYIYELIYTTMNDKDSIMDTLKDLPFDDKYDYDFKDINFTEKIQDGLYNMPIHVFFKLLVYTILYENEEYFDAIFKVLKYRIKNDENEEFIKDSELGTILNLIESIIDNLGARKNFDFEGIKERIDTNRIIRKIEKNNDIKICPKCGKPYITKCHNCELD